MTSSDVRRIRSWSDVADSANNGRFTWSYAPRTIEGIRTMHSFGNVIHLVLNAVAYYVRIGLYLAGFAFLLIFLGVVLPAVWSTRPDRRQAVTDILAHMLNALRYR